MGTAITQPVQEWTTDRLLVLAGRLIGMGQQRCLAEVKLTPSGFTVLSALVGGPLPLGDVARSSMVRAATLTAIVDALEAAGLVRRTLDPRDRRVVRLEMTPSGEIRQREGRDLLATYAQEHLPTDEADQAALRSLLLRLVDSAADDDHG